jgi:hypothetical protein
MSKYDDHIKEYLAKVGSPYGKCREAAKEMKEAFPELTIVRGFIIDMLWGERNHWWLVDTEGKIVDPTKTQFPCVFSYNAWRPGDPVRFGTCMECGAGVYRRVSDLDIEDSFCDEPGGYIPGTFCSQSCEDSFVLAQGG